MEEETPLAERKCEPCHGGVPPLSGQQIEDLLEQLNDWQVEQGHHLVRIFSFPDFVSALDHVNRVGALAEELGHHPNIAFTWGKVEISIWTHAIDGLSEADFVLAARIDRCAQES